MYQLLAIALTALGASLSDRDALDSYWQEWEERMEQDADLQAYADCKCEYCW